VDFNMMEEYKIFDSAVIDIDQIFIFVAAIFNSIN
jgi:hypothetical protein